MQTTPTNMVSNRFESDGRYFKVATIAELEQRPFKVVTIEDRHILLLHADGQIRALDSRCPLMGYPLSQGTIRDGVLRCHWHHWRFDLASGGCFTEGGDDVAVFPVEVRADAVWVSPVPLDGYQRQRSEKLLGDLRQTQQRRSIRRVRSAHGLDERLRNHKVTIRLFHLAEIGSRGHALHARYTDVCIADLQAQRWIAANVRREPPQVIERRVDDQLTDFRAAGELARFILNIEELIR